MTEGRQEESGAATDRDGDLGDVLRLAGRRAEPPADMAREIRAAVHAQWRETVAERRISRRRRWMSFAAAAAVAVLAVGAWLVRGSSGIGQEIASVDRVAGIAQVSRGWLSGYSELQAMQSISAGDRIKTDANSGVALKLSDGVILRL